MFAYLPEAQLKTFKKAKYLPSQIPAHAPVV